MALPDQPIAYVNGRLVPQEEAAISIFDRGFRTADAVFDTVRTIAHKPYKLREHTKRLFRSLRYARIDAGMSIEELESLTFEVLEHNVRFLDADDDVWIRQFVTRGMASRIGLPSDGRPSIIIHTERLPFSSIGRGYRDGVPLLVPSVRICASSAPDSRMKTTSRMLNNLAIQQVSAISAGADALLLDTDGYVAEGTGANFFAVIEGELLTAPDSHVLMGISRQTVFELASRIGIPLRVTRMSLYDVQNADEAFLTGTSFCILPVRSIDGELMQAGAPGPVTRRLTTQWIAEVGHDFVSQATSRLSQ
ncbi:aminotransferase class IV [Ensifer sp. ENS07]|uniref:aminotransferase class IV n=1 Tax=Ensifer sp. ENS07 TaxID=2769274 RepID=UPI00177BA4F4|nr:aminotransferase class IV [Ensifer sp. ENS07]MBD9638774.1 aminotransferase class IV [Ensifer sp. ENS07]